MEQNSISDKILAKVRNEPTYVQIKTEISNKLNNYENLNSIEKNNAWSWIYKRIESSNWNRQYAYAFYFDYTSNDNISDELFDEFSNYLSTVTGDYMPIPGLLRFEGEPIDPYELRDYIRSNNWLYS